MQPSKNAANLFLAASNNATLQTNEDVQKMAFDIAGKSSLRATLVQKGADYMLIDFARKRPFAAATFLGWFDKDGKETTRPGTIKSMDPGMTMKFMTIPAADSALVPEEVVLVKDPAGYGAVFHQQGDRLYRVTMYSDNEHIAELRAARVAAAKAKAEARAAEKAAEEAAKAETPVVETTAEEVPEAA